MKEFALTIELPISVRDYFCLFVRPAEFHHKFHAACGDEDVTIGPWRALASGRQQRISKFATPMTSNYILSKLIGAKTVVQETQEVYWDADKLCIETSTLVSGRIGEHFRAALESRVAPAGESGCTASFLVRVEYNGSYLKDSIEGHAIDQAKAALLKWQEMCSSALKEYRTEMHSVVESATEETPQTSDDERDHVSDRLDLTPEKSKELPLHPSATVLRAHLPTLSLSLSSSSSAPGSSSSLAAAPPMPEPVAVAAAPPATAAAPPAAAGKASASLAMSAESEESSFSDAGDFVDAEAAAAGRHEQQISSLNTDLMIAKSQLASLQNRIKALEEQRRSEQTVGASQEHTRERLEELHAMLKAAEQSRREKERMLTARLAELERRVGAIWLPGWRTGALVAAVLVVWPVVAHRLWRLLSAGPLGSFFAAFFRGGRN